MVNRMQGTELKFTSPRSASQLRSKIRVCKPLIENRSIVLRRIALSAMWDTGAAVSAISRRAAEKIGVRIYERTLLGTAAGILPTFNDIVLLDLFISDCIIPVKAAVVDAIPGQDNDFLIGMDVIQCGDMSISTNHVAGDYCVSFKPYPGIFKPIADILPKPCFDKIVDD